MVVYMLMMYGMICLSVYMCRHAHLCLYLLICLFVRCETSFILPFFDERSLFSTTFSTKFHLQSIRIIHLESSHIECGNIVKYVQFSRCVYMVRILTIPMASKLINNTHAAIYYSRLIHFPFDCLISEIFS